MGEPGAGQLPGSRLALVVPTRSARLALAAAIVVNLLVLFWPLPLSGGPGLFPFADKVAHMAVFAAVALTGRRAGVPLLPLVLLLVVHAAWSELVQHYLLPTRSGDVGDIGADLAGVAAGTVLPRTGVAARLRV